MKILIVEDNKTKRAMMKHILLEKGHDVTEAENGVKGLDAALSQQFDMILSDILMPEMDGFMFLRAVKKEETLKRISFIFYSFVFTGHLEQKLAYILGAEAFIVPSSINDFYRELSNIIDGIRLQDDVTIRALYPDEEVFLRKYGAVVAIKLEEKVKDLEKMTQSLKDTKDRLSHLLSQTPAVIYSCETEYPFAVTFISENIVNLTGYTVTEFMENPDFRADRIHPDDKEGVFAELAVFTSNTNKMDYKHEYRFLHKDGRYRYLYDEFKMVVNESGRPVEIIGFLIDITARKDAEAALKKSEENFRTLNAELEQRVKERTAQLEAINKELEAFSYSVSHDLRAPLRSIDGFGQILLEKYGNNLDEQGKTYLDRVCKATKHMGRLIDDMLKLSRITRAEFKRRNINISDMIRATAVEYQKSNPDRIVDVIVQDGIMVHGDLSLMQIAMENLINNAFKFTSKEEHPKIEFGTTVSDGKKVCFIRDNGAGFDMAYAGKLCSAPFSACIQPVSFRERG